MGNCHLEKNGKWGKHVCFDISAGCSWRIDTCDNMNLLTCKFIAFSHLYFSFQALGFLLYENAFDFYYMMHLIKT